MTSVEATWPLASLGEVAETSLGKMLDAARPKGDLVVPYLRNSNVQWGRIHLDDLLTVPLSTEERARFSVEPGDLLVCEGGDVGRAAVWRGELNYVAYQKALHRVRPSDALDVDYLRFLLEHYSKTGLLVNFSTGSTIKHLPQQQLRRLPVPLPPVAEQRRIVMRLEQAWSATEHFQTQLAVLQSRTESLRRSVLVDAYGRVRTPRIPDALGVEDV